MPDGRANNGGARRGAGRRQKDDADELRSVLSKCASTRKRKAILKKLVEDSEHSSFKIRHEARKLLLAYLYGKPVDRVQVETEGGRPIPITIIEVTELKARFAERRKQIEALDD
jgi:hypothetical protein